MKLRISDSDRSKILKLGFSCVAVAGVVGYGAGLVNGLSWGIRSGNEQGYNRAIGNLENFRKKVYEANLEEFPEESRNRLTNLDSGMRDSIRVLSGRNIDAVITEKINEGYEDSMKREFLEK